MEFKNDTLSPESWRDLGEIARRLESRRIAIALESSGDDYRENPGTLGVIGDVFSCRRLGDFCKTNFQIWFRTIRRLGCR